MSHGLHVTSTTIFVSSLLDKVTLTKDDNNSYTKTYNGTAGTITATPTDPTVISAEVLLTENNLEANKEANKDMDVQKNVETFPPSTK